MTIHSPEVIIDLDPLPDEATVKDRSHVASKEIVPASGDQTRWVIRHWPMLLATVAFATYLGFGLWMLYGADYAIGDALARAAAARSVVHSRDQHLMGIGFYWMPLPTLVQAPFMAVFSRLGIPDLPIPLATSIAGALTVFPLTRAGRALGLRERWSFVIVVLYVFNPYVVFFAANGMSEAWAALFLAFTVTSYLRWAHRRRTRDLGVLGLFLALALLSKYEVLGSIPFIAAVVGLQSPRGRRVVMGLIAALPALFTFCVWSAVALVITGKNPFQLVFGMSGGANEPTRLVNPGWLPDERTPTTAAAYALKMTLLVAPGVLLAVLVAGGIRESFALLHALGNRFRRPVAHDLLALGVALPFAVFPGQVAYLLLKGTTYGNPRYFTPLVLALAFLSLVTASRVRRVRAGVALCGLAIVSLVGYATALATMSNPKASKVESEFVVLEKLRGRPASGNLDIGIWRTFTASVDSLIGSRDVLAVDSTIAQPFTLFTKHPKNVVLDRDKDAQQLTARKPTPFTLILFSERAAYTAMNSALGEILGQPPPGKQWVVALEGPLSSDGSSRLRLYRLVEATSTSPGPSQTARQAGAPPGTNG